MAMGQCPPTRLEIGQAVGSVTSVSSREDPSAGLVRPPAPAGGCRGKLAGTAGWKGYSVSEHPASLSNFSAGRSSYPGPHEQP